jgi:hypothetical protein
MQAFICAVVRARTKLGIAMAASKPMMATTIIISTSVNPEFLTLLIFMTTNFTFLFSLGPNKATGGLFMIASDCSILPVTDRWLHEQTICHPNPAKPSASKMPAIGYIPLKFRIFEPRPLRKPPLGSFN